MLFTVATAVVEAGSFVVLLAAFGPAYLPTNLLTTDLSTDLPAYLPLIACPPTDRPTYPPWLPAQLFALNLLSMSLHLICAEFYICTYTCAYLHIRVVCTLLEGGSMLSSANQTL